MSESNGETLNVLVDVISDVCGLDKAKLTASANAVDELGVDSVDMLDIMYELNRRFSIKIPIEQWSEDISSGRSSTADYFILGKFAERIERLAQGAGQV